MDERTGLRTLYPKSRFSKENVFYSFVILLAIILGVGSLIAVLILGIFIKPKELKELQPNDIFDSQFSPISLSAQFVDNSGNTLVYWETNPNDAENSDSEEKCALVRLATDGKRTPILKYEEIKNLGLSCNTPFEVSVDGSFIILKTNETKLFRHSTLGKYYYIDLTKEKVLHPLSPNEHKKQSVAKFCRAENGASKVAFVEENNLFYRDIQTGETHQITNDGVEGIIFNGVADWLYEEEILGQDRAFEWNPDCTRIAFYKFDDTKVTEHIFPFYDPKSPNPTSQLKVRIPNVGETNPTVSLHVYTLRQGVSQITIQDEYLVDIQWISSDRLGIVTFDRYYQTKKFGIADIAGTTITPQFVGVYNSTTWVSSIRHAKFFEDEETKFYVDIEPVYDRYQIVLHTYPSGEVKLLTNGSFDVTNIFAVTKTHVFYARTGDNGASRFVYSVSIADGKETLLTENSIDESSDSKVKGEFFSAKFSDDASNFILSNLGPNVPSYTLKRLKDGKFVEVAVLLDNSALENVRKEYYLPTSEYDVIETEDEMTYEAIWTFPPFFSRTKEHATVVIAYGGPEAQLVQKTYARMNNQLAWYLARDGFVVLTVDTRGSGGRGHTWTHQVYKKLGHFESQDTVKIAKAVSSRPYVKPDAIAIYGHSYGGYTTLMSLLRDEGDEEREFARTFKTGISGAPVTDWRYYDSAYTEKYMGSLFENEEAYRNSSVFTYINPDSLNQDNPKLAQNLIIVHGLTDENVRPLNAFNLITTLVENGITFDSVFYPNKDHSISGEKTKPQLYKYISRKLKATLPMPPF